MDVQNLTEGPSVAQSLSLLDDHQHDQSSDEGDDATSDFDQDFNEYVPEDEAEEEPLSDTERERGIEGKLVHDDPNVPEHVDLDEDFSEPETDEDTGTKAAAAWDVSRQRRRMTGGAMSVTFQIIN